jgi:hypothetical protein
MSLFFLCVFISCVDTPVILLVVLSGGNSYDARGRLWLMVFASKTIAVPFGVSPSLFRETAEVRDEAHDKRQNLSAL